MNRPRISVVMGVYNGERYLRKAVESILRQSFADFEFIIVNDESSDATAHLLAEFKDRDSRVRVIE
jgi:glycosyltransferase involved in cell wall biosynthesis